jgi:hypothetical protein
MRRLVLAVIGLGGVCAGVALAGAGPGQQAAEAARGRALTPLQQRLVSGSTLRALEQPAAARTSPQLQALATRTSATGCPENRGSNCASTRTART